MKVQVDYEGTLRTVDVSVDRITLRESVEIQRIIGGDEWDAFAAGKMRPVALQAVLYVKMRKEIPDLSIDDFDIPMTDIEAGDDENPTNGS